MGGLNIFMSNIKPTILLMFSGGLDSTGALWKLIRTKEELLVHHIYLCNKEKRAEAENKSVKDIIAYMKNIRDFTYTESYHEYPSYNNNFMWDSDIYNFVAGTICLCLKSIKEVAIGRTKSDTGVEQRADRGTKILHAFDPNIKKLYPVGDMTKKEIYEMLPEDLRNLTWSCRTPIYKDNNTYECNKCKTCREVILIKKENN
jgi:7-cyano-7-deazaguanine synthase in queuosine biosynthesis